MAHITIPTTTIEADTLLLVMLRSAVLKESMHGTPLASITVSSTIHAHPTLLASRRPRAPRFCRMRTLRVSQLGNMWTLATSGRCIQFAAGRSGSNSVLCFGMDASIRWSRQIEQPGMPSCRDLAGRINTYACSLMTSKLVL